MFRDLEREQKVLTGLAAHVAFGANLAFQRQTVNGVGELVSGSYFPLLGVQPALGRLLSWDDDRNIGGHFVTVLSYDYWASRLGADPAVLNQPIVVNGQSMTIVGVARKGFTGTTLGNEPKVFVPITMRAQMIAGWKGFDNRQGYWAYLFGRLKPGVSIEQAHAGLNAVYKPIVNDVEAPLQKGMSDQTLKRFRAKEIDGRTRVSRAELDPSGSEDAAALPDVGHRASCCSSRARTSRTCCSRAAPRARPRWRCGCRSVRAAVSCSRSC